MVREVSLLVIVIVNAFEVVPPMVRERILFRVTVIAVNGLMVAVVATENPLRVNRETMAGVSAYVNLTGANIGFCSGWSGDECNEDSCGSG